MSNQVKITIKGAPGNGCNALAKHFASNLSMFGVDCEIDSVDAGGKPSTRAIDIMQNNRMLDSLGLKGLKAVFVVEQDARDPSKLVAEGDSLLLAKARIDELEEEVAALKAKLNSVKEVMEDDQ